MAAQQTAAHRTGDRHPAFRTLQLWVVPAGVLVAVVAPLLALGGQLPDPLAVRWGEAARPSAYIAYGTLVATLAGTWLVAWAALLLGERLPPRRGHWRLVLAAVVFGTGGFLVGFELAMIALNLHAPSWHDAADLTPIPLLAELAFAVLGAQAGRALAAARQPPQPAPLAGTPSPSVGLGQRERAVWLGATSSPFLATIGVSLGVAVIAVTLLVGGGPVLVLLAAGIVLALMVVGLSRIRVAVGPEAVRISLGPWSMPSTTVPLTDIVLAEAITVEPERWGGWGYRRVLGQRAAGIVLRPGPGLRLTRTDGRTLVVTIDRAEEAAGLVNDYVRRRGQGDPEDATISDPSPGG
jgi:hypothetical protein